MIKDNNNLLKIIIIFLIIICAVLCMQHLNVVYAESNESIVTISNQDGDNNITVNDTYISFTSGNKSYIEIKDKDTLYTHYPRLTVTSKPSCQSCHRRLSYKWRTKTWINYCPHCKKYNTLTINPKGVYEVEITCRNDDSDYCGVCGHDKCANYYRHKNYYLMEG